jgi:hypothetical protein
MKRENRTTMRKFALRKEMELIQKTAGKRTKTKITHLFMPVLSTVEGPDPKELII